MTASQICRILIRKPLKPGQEDKLKIPYDHLSASLELRLNLCSNIIGNTICADLLDYLYRDWYHIGIIRSVDERIYQYMEVHPNSKSPHAPVFGQKDVDGHTLPRRHDDEFVIALGNRSKIRSDGVSAILRLLEWRYELAEVALYHRTKVAAAAMMDRAFFDIFEGWPEDRIVGEVLCASDDELLERGVQVARDRMKRCEVAKENERKKFESAIRLLRHIQSRRLFKHLISFGPHEVTGEQGCELGVAAGRQKCISLVLQGRFVDPETGRWEGKVGYDPKTGACNRAKMMGVLEREFGLDQGSLAMYLVQVAPKIAEVNVAVDGVIKPFNVHPTDLSGGHLKAQITRFVGMWKIHFFIDENAKTELKDNEDNARGEFFLSDLVQAIRYRVTLFRDHDRLSDLMLGLATRIRKRMSIAGHNRVREKEEPLESVPRHDKMAGGAAVQEDECPSHAPSLRSFIDGVYE